jgi:hypothetical protein
MVPLSKLFQNPDIDWDYEKHKERFERKLRIGKLTDTSAIYDTIKGYRFEDVYFEVNM